MRHVRVCVRVFESVRAILKTASRVRTCAYLRVNSTTYVRACPRVSTCKTKGIPLFGPQDLPCCRQESWGCSRRRARGESGPCVPYVYICVCVSCARGQRWGNIENTHPGSDGKRQTRETDKPQGETGSFLSTLPTLFAAPRRARSYRPPMRDAIFEMSVFSLSVYLSLLGFLWSRKCIPEALCLFEGLAVCDGEDTEEAVSYTHLRAHET